MGGFEEVEMGIIYINGRGSMIHSKNCSNNYTKLNNSFLSCLIFLGQVFQEEIFTKELYAKKMVSNLYYTW